MELPEVVDLLLEALAAISLLLQRLTTVDALTFQLRLKIKRIKREIKENN